MIKYILCMICQPVPYFNFSIIVIYYDFQHCVFRFDQEPCLCSVNNLAWNVFIHMSACYHTCFINANFKTINPGYRLKSRETERPNKIKQLPACLVSVGYLIAAFAHSAIHADRINIFLWDVFPPPAVLYDLQCIVQNLRTSSIRLL